MAENRFLPIIEEEEIEIDDDFYEKIEAPKFVDLTAPDKRHPDDDRHWFCARFGCDQKHEEELDSEAIYKSFVLRVMAARSPNVRLRKALNRREREASSNLKCPLSAPAKPRMSRMAFISSLSHKVTENNVKVAKPLSKVTATPNAKVKQPLSVTKALTTPRNQKKVSNLEQFRSVQNKKTTTVAVAEAKNRVVAKSLVFNSPKKVKALVFKSPKVVGTKSSVESNTSMKTLCSAMKKLDFTGVKKNGEECNNSLPVASSRKPLFRGREVKSRVFNSLYSSNQKELESNRVRSLKEKKLKEMQKHKVLVSQSDSNDMGIEEKSRSESIEGGESSILALSEASRNDITSQSSRSGSLERGESSVLALSLASRDDITSLSSSNEEEKKTIEESENEEKRITVLDKGRIPEVIKRKAGQNSMAYHGKENEIEITENDDDKENSSAPSENITMSTNSVCSKNAILGSKRDDRKIYKKSTPTTAGSQVVKYRKLKPTNPKPFKFRTDERGILKEANLEKKITSPLKDTMAKDDKAAIRKYKNKNETYMSQSDRDNYSNWDEKSHKTAQSDQDSYSSWDEKSHKTTQRHQSGNIHSDNNSNSEVNHKLSAKTPQVNPGAKLQKNVVLDENFKRKSKMMQHGVRPLSVLSRKKDKVAVVKPSDIVKPKETAKSSKHDDATCLQGRRALTVPKEPKFHSIHVPKSCTTRKPT
ncbi:uncharacterized protein LOC127083643 [Lathyrus oleraceus]|uniref:Uncharacterized protein n=1 Tax=Pisum sativum TaxID=3888 RepID=A0A9D5BQV0_PEA|nr:uncharacterized protein LOC127083643 [Pisum sativum]KAI5448274.1 hypothetical protein KIW84_015629 [Pisum sativum]